MSDSSAPASHHDGGDPVYDIAEVQVPVQQPHEVIVLYSTLRVLPARSAVGVLVDVQLGACEPQELERPPVKVPTQQLMLSG